MSDRYEASLSCAWCPQLATHRETHVGASGNVARTIYVCSRHRNMLAASSEPIGPKALSSDAEIIRPLHHPAASIEERGDYTVVGPDDD